MHGSEHLGDDSSSNDPLHGDSDQTHGWSEDKGAGELVGRWWKVPWGGLWGL